MRIIKTPISDYYSEAKDFLVQNRNEEAQESIDKAIILVSRKKCGGVSDEDLVEGVPLRIWYDRLWQFLENNNLILE